MKLYHENRGRLTVLSCAEATIILATRAVSIQPLRSHLVLNEVRLVRLLCLGSQGQLRRQILYLSLHVPNTFGLTFDDLLLLGNALLEPDSGLLLALEVLCEHLLGFPDSLCLSLALHELNLQ